MKKLIIAFLILLYSCRKDNSADTPSDVYLKYKANGTQQEFNGNAAMADADGVFAAKFLPGSGIQHTLYTLQAKKGVNNALFIGIETDTLQAGNDYHAGSPELTVVLINGTNYYSLTNTLDIHISKHQSGLLDGSFSGKLYSYNQQTVTDSINISEGEFKNVRVSY